MEEVTLPNEIWLEIFKRIDRPKLMELRLVCHRFYDLIEYLLNKSSAWEMLCRKKIKFHFMQTMQRAYPYDLVYDGLDINDPVLWRGTYLSYKKWLKVLVNPHTKVTIAPATSNFGNISCVRTFDKYIAIASHDGSISCYTIDNISQPFYLANHGTNLIQVEFWYSNGDVLVASVADDCTLKFWDLENKIEIATNGFFAKGISIGECRHFCIGDMGGILTSYQRVGNHISPGPTLNLKLKDGQTIIAHFIGGIHMTAMVWEEGDTILFECGGEIEDGKLIKLEMEHELSEKYMDLLKKSLGASLNRLVLPTYRFCFGIDENCIGFNVVSQRIAWDVCNYRRHFGCNVKSIAMHAKILMFGLEDGSIRLLEYSSMLEPEYALRHSKIIEVDTEPIVGLTVLEVDKKPCTVAVTAQKVHFIKFF